MSIVTINEAANLVGKSIKTIYRHIESGKLSYAEETVQLNLVN